MFCSFSQFVASLVILSSVACAESEDHGASCACQAEENGFTIDCSDGDSLSDALVSLQQDNCDSNCDSDSCKKNYLIIQSHHDYCFHEELPEPVEDSIHLYEDQCGEGCDIEGKFDPNLPMCPTANCEDNSGNEAYQNLLNANCLDGCNATASCSSNYRVLLSVHDSCAEEVLDTAVELAFHDFEEACEEFACNVNDAAGDLGQLVCKGNSSGPTTRTGIVASIVVSIMVIMTAAL